MKYIAEIDIMPLKALLDPQGKAINQSMQKIGLSQVNNVRMGKHIQLKLEAASEKEAHRLAEEACKKILSNPVMESYTFIVNKG